MTDKLKPYQVGESDIVAAHSKGEAAQILADYCGFDSDEMTDDDIMELPLEMKLQDEEGNFLSTLGDYMKKVEKAEYLVGWE